MADGISEERIKLSRGRNWVKFEATIEEAEYLFKTEYKVYESKDDMTRRSLATDEYSVPLTVRDHIDFITPTTQFDAIFSKPKRRAVPAIKKAAIKSTPVADMKPRIPGGAISDSDGIETADSSSTFDPTDLTICNQYITTECLRALYNIPNGTLAHSSLNIVEYTPQSFIPADLATFLYNIDPWIPYQTQPHVDLVDGAVLSTAPGDFYQESNLDLQLAVPLGKLPFL